VTRKKTRCNKSACKDSEFCEVHLLKNDSVVIGKSRIPQGGLGLFAWTARDVGSQQRKDKKPPLFTKNKYITAYGGRRTTPEKLSKWYDYKNDNGEKIETTAPYALTMNDGTIRDAACKRRAGAYVNDYRGSGKRPNAELKDDGVYALKNIYKGDEILVDYGSEYWKGSGPEYLTSIQKYKKPSKNANRHTSRGKKIRGR